jgi:beta-glucosidase-like glycosyl hydrolase
MAEGHAQKLAPHMMVGLGGPRLTDDERAILSSCRFPGVILFDRNVQDARQLMELARETKRLFLESHGYIPLIAADQEGGIISVLGRAIGVPPTQMAAARTGDIRCCERLFAENARRLRACGVNMLLGPVADINSEYRNPVIGTRSFGEDAEVVSSFVSAAVSAARTGGVLTCIKHFPGHGPSRIDSHLALPLLGATVAQLKQKDILPFASGFEAGAETVMVGHIAPLDRALPASLDPEIIGGLLRMELGFKGIVITDALEMEGVKTSGPCAADAAAGAPGETQRALERIEPATRAIGEICKRALEAGNDMLLFSKPVAEVMGGLRSLENSAPADTFWNDGASDFLKSSKARIEGLLQIASQKDREFELPSDPGVYGEIAEKSIRVTAGSEASLPLGPEKGFRAVFYAERGGFDGFPAKNFVTRVLQGFEASGEEGADAGASVRFGRYALRPYGAIPNAAASLEALAFSMGTPGATMSAPGATGNCVFLMNRRPLSEEVIREICSGARVVVVAGWPYAADFIPSGPHVLVTYGVYDAAADAVRRRISAK